LSFEGRSILANGLAIAFMVGFDTTALTEQEFVLI